ncbi:G-protein coupled receptor 183-like [Lineus longissimus]|uniref:G-protein coupled receptor 183-like n=1 Tax=Lineus longissimus TaxID=88925 RepID=UPI00315D5824
MTLHESSNTSADKNMSLLLMTVKSGDVSTPVSYLKYPVDTAIYIMTVPTPPILITVGLIGNFLSFRLMSLKKYEKSTTCFYMRYMAVTDSLYIYGRIFLRYIRLMAPHLFVSDAVKRPFCLYYFATGLMSYAMSPWILVALAFDRFLALTWPLKAAIFCTMRRARRTTICVFIFGFCYGLVQLLRTRQEKYKFWLCPYYFKEPADEIHAITEGILMSICPILTLCVFNIGIIIAVHRSKQNEALKKSSGAETSKESSITLAAVSVTTAFIIFQLPDTINDFFWANWKGIVTSDVAQWQRLTLNIDVLCESMNYCLNSYLYVLSCKRLRKEMLGIILSCNRKLNR